MFWSDVKEYVGAVYDGLGERLCILGEMLGGHAGQARTLVPMSRTRTKAKSAKSKEAEHRDAVFAF